MSRRLAIILIVIVVAIPVAWKVGKQIIKANAEADANAIQDRGLPPELEAKAWYNTGAPVQLADLKGQVVLLDFWRFQCPECVDSMPYIQRVYAQYQGKGLHVISIHSPETQAEYDLNQLQQFMAAYKIKYPVAIDTDHSVFRSYQLRAWPTWILIDKQGHMRFQHIGEGSYDLVDHALATLMAEN